MNVSNRRKQMSFTHYRMGVEAVLENLPYMPMPAVEVLCVANSDALHGFREVGAVRAKQQVDMVVHEAPCVDAAFRIR